MTVTADSPRTASPRAAAFRRTAPAAAGPDAAAHPDADAVCPPLPVLGDDVRVPLVTGRDVAYAALDQAASAPALRRVWDDVAAYAPYYGSVHRGAGYLSQLSTDLFEQSRAAVAEFLGCRPDDHVVFTRSTTDSLNLLAAALPQGAQVFVFATEHHAALLPWQRAAGARVTYLPAPRSPEQAVGALDAALHGAPQGPKLVCVTGASNVTGEVWPVRELAAAAHRHGARVVLDAAQLVPHRAVDVAALDVDWIAFSGHKLYAPFGSGVLAGRPDWLTRARPYLAGGGAARSVAQYADDAGRTGLDVAWHTTVARHEAGSPNVIGAYAIASACRALREAGSELLERREQALLAELREGLAAAPGVRVLSLFGRDADRVGVLSFTVDGWSSAHLAAALSAEHGIGVRDGQFCAHPLVRTLLGGGASGASGASGGGGAVGGAGECGAASAPAQAVRVSFGAGTPREHVQRLVGAVRTLVRDGAAWRYHTLDGRCVPARS